MVIEKEFKWLNSISLKWIRFWKKKWSKVVQNYVNEIFDVHNIQDNRNLFMTINWYKNNSKSRQEKNIKNINAFFLDIDLQDNPWKEKDDILDKIMEYKEDFSFIVESLNGFHLYILIDWNEYVNEDWSIDFEKYKNDWKTTKLYYDKIMELEFDDNAMKTSQIWRLVGSMHQKDEKQEKFKIKLLKGEELLENGVIEQINKLPITKVAEKLWIQYDEYTKRLYENWELTDWRRICIKWNYINNFTIKKIRNIWWSFAFVLNYFKEKNWNNVERNNIDTFEFFEKNFWIQSSKDINKNIKLNKFISINLFNNWFSQENLKYFLYLQYYATKNYLIDWMYSERLEVWELKDFIWDIKIKNVTIIKNLEELNNKSIINVISSEKSILQNFQLLDIQFKKEDWIKFKFSILPKITNLKKIFNIKYFHFFNKNILNLNSNNNLLLDLYLYLHKKLVLTKKQKLLIKNNELDNFKINKNPSLRNKTLQNFCKTLKEFEVIKKWNDWFEFINPRVINKTKS